MIQGVQTQQLTAVCLEQIHDGTAVATCELLSQLAPHASEASIVKGDISAVPLQGLLSNPKLPGTSCLESLPGSCAARCAVCAAPVAAGGFVLDTRAEPGRLMRKTNRGNTDKPTPKLFYPLLMKGTVRGFPEASSMQQPAASKAWAREAPAT